ncbi:MAG: hypothetical protein WCK54_20065 [Desulfuromonadales bacterium]
MFWLIIILIAGALLIKLGALSVLVTVLAVSLKAVIGLVAGIGLLMLYIQNRKP